MRFLLENFEKHKTDGLTAYRAGDGKEARYHFLKAAEYLFQLAEKTAAGELRAVRIKNAEELVALAKKIRTGGLGRAGQGGGGKAGGPERAREDADGAGPSDWIVQEKPRVRFADVAGLDAVKDEIRVKMIYPFTHPEQAERYCVKKGGGVLLYGPPGTGKTLIARAIAGELDATIFAITPSKILSKWVGEAEKNVTALFSAARACDRAVIFVDEIESLVPRRRANESTVMARVVPQILAELDGFDGRADAPLLFIGATNEPWSLDYAVLRPGRFDAKIYISLPDLPARLAILRMNTKGMPLAEDVDLAEVAQRLDGYSGADIAHLCRKTAESLFKESVEHASNRPIARADFLAMLGEMRPSVSGQDLKRFEDWRV